MRSQTAESDVFILSGAEDLVPVLKKDDLGEWVRDTMERPDHTPDYRIDRYWPRIERWTRLADDDVRWTLAKAPGSPVAPCFAGERR